MLIPRKLEAGNLVVEEEKIGIQTIWEYNW